MSLDTEFRPKTYSDVIGQEDNILLLRQYVASGSGFHQSYLFYGGYGRGKTTLARIFVRALLCDNPSNGEPCGSCSSCVEILKNGGSESFTEVDAATHSGKEDIKKIVTSLQYLTFSGKPRVILFDEAHELSKKALDGLLKVTEECRPGTQDKKLVCIFCTTEPEKMRATLCSRSAPAFVVRPVAPVEIAKRLETICGIKGFEYEKEALVLISELTRSHIRDALKHLEALSLLGPITVSSVRDNLKLNSQEMVLDIISHLGKDLQALTKIVFDLELIQSSTQTYQMLCEMAMQIYRIQLGVGKTPLYWDVNKVERATTQKENLLLLTKHLSTRPLKTTSAMLLCDLSLIHHEIASGGVQISKPLVKTLSTTPEKASVSLPKQITPPPPVKSVEPSKASDVTSAQSVGKIKSSPSEGSLRKEILGGVEDLDSMPSLDGVVFRMLLRRRVAELRAEKLNNGYQRRTNLGRT